MITLNKNRETPYFSNLVRNPYEADPVKSIRPDYSPLGYVIFRKLREFREIAPGTRITQYVIMPDHVHFIVEIETEIRFPLGDYIAKFKRSVNREARERNILIPGLNQVFESGFNDQFLTYRRSLDTLYQYIKKNPYNLWERRENPEWYRRIRDISLYGFTCCLYGNPDLLEHPFIYPVIVHRSDYRNPEVLKKKWELWEYAIYNDGVLAGAFVNKEEKRVRDLASLNGTKIIYLKNEIYTARNKPKGELYEYCKNGKLLIVSPDMEKELGKRRDFRGECRLMNSLIEKMTGER